MSRDARFFARLVRSIGMGFAFCVLAIAHALLVHARAAHADSIGPDSVSGTLTLAGSPYCVVGSIYVNADTSLTIDAGVVLRFPQGSTFQVFGTLTANGTSGAPVVFTSGQCDEVTKLGYWQGLLLADGSTTTLSFTEVRYGIINVHAPYPSQRSTAVLTWNGGATRFASSYGIVSTATTSLSNLTAQGCGSTGIVLQSMPVPATLSNITCLGNAVYAISVQDVLGDMPGTISGSGNGTNGIFVKGEIGDLQGPPRRARWEANATFPYVLGIVGVNHGDTLEIAAGAVLKAPPFIGALGVVDSARIVVDGTSSAPVWFTSLKDDAHGGDTNNNGSATSPVPGDWSGIEMSNRGTLIMRNAWVAYGGYTFGAVSSQGLSSTTLDWDGGGALSSGTAGVRCAGGASLKNLSIANCMSDGIRLLPQSPPVFNQITCTNNGGYAIAVDGNAGSFPGTLSGSGNGTNGIYVTGEIGSSAPTRSAFRWGRNPSLSYVLDGALLARRDTLTIDAGTVVKFARPAAYLGIQTAGVLRTRGTSNSPVWFTSLKDDAHGGDTNRDGGASSAAPGDWQAITFADSTSADLQETGIRYGGYVNPGQVVFPSSGDTLRWSGGALLSSQTAGLVSGGHLLSLEGLSVGENAGDGIRVTDGDSALIAAGDFFANGSLAVNCITSSGPTVDARGCWWGDASGPYDPAGGIDTNPGGLGEPVSDYVRYRPWSTVPTSVDDAMAPTWNGIVRVTPNPFQKSSVCFFALIHPGHVRVEVLDVAGRIVADLLDGTLPAGHHTVSWNGRDGIGHQAPAGVYFWRVKSRVGAAMRRTVRIE